MIINARLLLVGQFNLMSIHHFEEERGQSIVSPFFKDWTVGFLRTLVQELSDLIHFSRLAISLDNIELIVSVNEIDDLDYLYLELFIRNLLTYLQVIPKAFY